MEKRKTYMENRIDKSVEVFKRIYLKDELVKTEDELGQDVGKNLELSNIVGNSSFSPIIKKVPVYQRYRQYKGWGKPSTYKFVLGINPKVNDGIKEDVSVYNINELDADIKNLTENEIIEKVKEFLSLSNKQVIEKFNIDSRIFSKESLDILNEVDKRNELLNKNES